MSNHLKNATSPYLLQHAENPVDWYPWCKQAFEKAKSEDKPIFLSIGYSNAAGVSITGFISSIGLITVSAVGISSACLISA